MAQLQAISVCFSLSNQFSDEYGRNMFERKNSKQNQYYKLLDAKTNVRGLIQKKCYRCDDIVKNSRKVTTFCIVKFIFLKLFNKF